MAKTCSSADVKGEGLGVGLATPPHKNLNPLQKHQQQTKLLYLFPFLLYAESDVGTERAFQLWSNFPRTVPFVVINVFTERTIQRMSCHFYTT